MRLEFVTKKDILSFAVMDCFEQDNDYLRVIHLADASIIDYLILGYEERLKQINHSIAQKKTYNAVVKYAKSLRENDLFLLYVSFLSLYDAYCTGDDLKIHYRDWNETFLSLLQKLDSAYEFEKDNTIMKSESLWFHLLDFHFEILGHIADFAYENE